MLVKKRTQLEQESSCHVLEDEVRRRQTSYENLQSLDKQMGDAMNLIVNDKKEGHTLNTLMTSNSLFFSTDRDRLFYTVYEKS